MTLSNNIKRLEYGSWIFKGQNTTYTMLDMKAQINASLRKIGDAFNISHEAVNLRFAELRESDLDSWEEAKSKRQFYDNFTTMWRDRVELVEIAEKLQISIAQAKALERKLIPLVERKKSVSMESRQNNLARALFGIQFNAGENFELFVKRLFKKSLSGDKLNMMIDYYFNDVDMPSESRFTRFNSNRKIRKENEFDLEDLLEKGVICQNRSL